MKWFLPLLLWLALVPFTPTLDLAIESYFYQDGHFSTSPFLQFFYDYGTYPALLTAIIGAFSFRRTGIYLALVLAIGAGLIVNVILKDHWGQPRPRELAQFGGTREYTPIWKPNFSEPGKAFPCGHCAMGFFFFALCFVNKRSFWPGLALALTLGGILSIARMEQGGHYFSGVITSALIMWLTAYFLSLIVRPNLSQK